MWKKVAESGSGNISDPDKHLFLFYDPDKHLFLFYDPDKHLFLFYDEPLYSIHTVQ